MSSVLVGFCGVSLNKRQNYKNMSTPDFISFLWRLNCWEVSVCAEWFGFLITSLELPWVGKTRRIKFTFSHYFNFFPFLTSSQHTLSSDTFQLEVSTYLDVHQCTWITSVPIWFFLFTGSLNIVTMQRSRKWKYWSTFKLYLSKYPFPPAQMSGFPTEKGIKKLFAGSLVNSSLVISCSRFNFVGLDKMSLGAESVLKKKKKKKRKWFSYSRQSVNSSQLTRHVNHYCPHVAETRITRSHQNDWMRSDHQSPIVLLQFRRITLTYEPHLKCNK